MGYLVSFIFLVGFIGSITANRPLRNFHVEYREANADGVVLGIDVKNPRFSWSFPDDVFTHQVAYQIIVNHKLTNKLLWDTGKVNSDQSIHVLYDGKELESDNRYFVTVNVLASSGEMFTSTVQFHTGLYDVELDWTGDWIGHELINMNQLRKEFPISGSIVQATAFISGIGYYELYVNGENVDPTRKLDPGWTTYEARVLYSTFDVTKLLTTGQNAIGILLGNGWYSQDQNIAPAKIRPSYGPARVILQLNIQTQSGNLSVVTDPSWAGRESEILADSVYHGEKFDARLVRPNWGKVGFTDQYTLWVLAMKLPAPGGVLSAQMMEPIRTNPPVIPIKVWGYTLNIQLIDFGQNMAGWTRVKLTGPRGTTVRLRYAEILEQEVSNIYGPTIYQDNLRAAAQSDIYILNGTAGGEIYEPKFTVHGFRYVEVTNSWSKVDVTIEAIPVHSTTPPAGSFKTNNPVFNQIQHNILWGQQSNLMSLPTDCPQRDERKGWMGDAALTIDEALFNFKLAPFYQNWAQNIRDTQLANGAVGDTTPLAFGSAPADPAWGTAYPTTIYALCDHFADLTTAGDHYKNIKAWVDFLTGEVSKTGIANMYYHYGDWVPPPPHPQTNSSLTSAASYAIDVLHLSKIAGLLSNVGDQQKYQALYTQIGKNFHAAFYNSTTGGYADNSQTANTLALSIDAVPTNLQVAVLNNILSSIKAENNHFTVGILGLRYLLPLLSENGHHDVALQITTPITYPSFGYMFNNPWENATTLWELMDAPDEGPSMNSRNHIMWGSIGAWFYRYVGGIKPNGLQEIEISPAPVGRKSPVTSASVYYDSFKGKIAVDWIKTETSFGMNVVVPSATTGRVVVPKHESPYTLLSSNDEVIADFTGEQPVYFEHPGVDRINVLEDGSIELKVQPGKYNLFASV